MTTAKVCILCHSTFDSDKLLRAKENKEDGDLISKFYNDIVFNFGVGETIKSRRDGRLPPLPGGSWTSAASCEVTAVCQECSPLLEAALKKKEAVERVETSVRRLQLQLLKEMELLQNVITQFYGEMKKLQDFMEDARTLNISSQCSNTDWNAIKVKNAIKIGMHAFRKRIAQGETTTGEGVMQDLRHCTAIPDKTATIMEVDTDEQKSTLHGPGEVDKLLDADDGDINKTADFSRGVDLKIENASCVDIMMDNDLDNTPEGDDKDDQNYDDNLAEDNNESDSDNNRDELEKQETSRTTTSLGSFLSVDCSGMSPFRKYIVSQAVRRKGRILYSGISLQNREAKRFGSDSRISLMNRYFFDYNEETSALSLEDVTVTINDKQETQESTGYLQCTKCGHQVHSVGTKYYDIYKRILDHVLGKHLNLYHCQLCGMKCSSSSTLRSHMGSHNKVLKCDICGKPCSSNKTLRAHKWTHLSSEEKQQAINSGMSNPRKTKTVEGKPFQCSTCVMSFKTRAELNYHEKTHQRTTVVCPVCGKLVLETTFGRSHSKVCRPEGDMSLQHLPCSVLDVRKALKMCNACKNI